MTKNAVEAAGVRGPQQRTGVIGAISTDIGQETAKNEETGVTVGIEVVTEGMVEDLAGVAIDEEATQ